MKYSIVNVVEQYFIFKHKIKNYGDNITNIVELNGFTQGDIEVQIEQKHGQDGAVIEA